MTPPIVITVVVPTIKGREDLYELVTRKIWETTQSWHSEIITVTDAPNCGAAWQKGLQQARGQYVCLLADDVEPLSGWFEAGRYVVDHLNGVPGARILRPNGEIESCAAWETDGKTGHPADLARIPFASREQWEAIGDMVPIQYYSDNWFDYRAKRNGWPCIINTDYTFVHHRPKQLREGEEAQMRADLTRYEDYVAADQ